MNRRTFRILTMILGILLALAVVCSNVAVHKIGANHVEKFKTENSEKQEGEFAYVSAPTITPPTSANIETSLLAHCIFEIDQQQEDENIVATNISLQPRKLLVTLFRVIIAPNAP